MIVVFVAMEQEMRGLRACPDPAVPTRPPLYPTRSLGQAGTQAVAVRMGLGRQRAESAARWALEVFRPEAAVGVGFSGALVAGLSAGTLVICSQLTGDDAALPPIGASAALCDLAEQARARASLTGITGGCVTSGAMVTTAAAKRALGLRRAAVSVDMESYWLARACAEHAVPFLAVRAISDPLHRDLAGLDAALDEDGQVRVVRLLRVVLARPGLLPNLPALARDSRRASAALATFLGVFLPALADASRRATG